MRGARVGSLRDLRDRGSAEIHTLRGDEVPPFSEWQNFYVVVGSSAGALIGLQFVVMALIANTSRSQDLAQAGAAFTTPTIVHFTSALGVAAILCAPWHEVVPPFFLLLAAGATGLIYSVRNALVLRRQSAYTPEPEDWAFYAVLPMATYSLLAAASGIGILAPHATLYGVALSAMLLLGNGIHNAWDNVTYHVFGKASAER